jgi:hypothetical protein
MKTNLRKSDNEAWLYQVFQHLPRKTSWTDEEIIAMAHDPSHLSSDLLLGYANREISQDECAQVEEHIIFCDFCLHQVLEVTQLLQPDRSSFTTVA